MNKIVIIALIFAFGSGSEAQLQSPDEFQLLNPEFLRRISEAHQVAYHDLQLEIDQKIADINGMIATVLANVTSPSVGVYSTHANTIWSAYQANIAEIDTLNNTDCQDNAYEGNDYSITSSGFQSSNCITAYSKKVIAEAKLVSNKVREIKVDFDDVALNVIRAYLPPSNPMIDGEVIESLINSTFTNTFNNWSTVRPDLTALTTPFVNNLNAFGVTLQTCYNNARTYMQNMSDMVRYQVQACLDFSGSRRDQFIASLKKELMEKAESFASMQME